MQAEHKWAFSNVRIFRAIADRAYDKMSEDMDKNIRARPDGGPGVIKTFDPEQTSFKEAMISIVFTCIWLEATLHLLIVRMRGSKRFEEVDKRPYEEKLRMLGCGDGQLLNKVEILRSTRRQLVHEKAYFEFNEEGEFTGETRIAQDEAENARAVIVGVSKWCREVFNVDLN